MEFCRSVGTAYLLRYIVVLGGCLEGTGARSAGLMKGGVGIRGSPVESTREARTFFFFSQQKYFLPFDGAYNCAKMKNTDYLINISNGLLIKILFIKKVGWGLIATGLLYLQ